MNRNQKTDLVKTLRDTFEVSASVVVVHCIGLTVAESTDLRNKMRNDNCYFKVTKNTLTKRAIKDTNFEILDKLFVGPTSLAYSDDPVSTSKVMVEFSKNNENLKILGGVMGEKELSVDDINHLASLPSMDSLRAKIIGLLCAPQRNIVLALNGTQSNILRLINANFKTK